MINPKMIDFIQVLYSSELIPEFKAIYEEAFPPDERREWSQIAELLTNPNFSLNGIYHQEKFIGMLSVWNLDEFRFIEHFAILDSERGNGFGSAAIRQIISGSAVQVILEVEEPTTESAQKRIQFYEKLGFSVGVGEYYQPPYSLDKKRVKMQLMSYPEKIAEGYFPMIKDRIYRSVYGIIE